MEKQRKQYETLSIELMQLDFVQSVLSGSLTTKNIDVNEVSVEDYQKDLDFVDAGQDFKSISFD